MFLVSKTTIVKIFFRRNFRANCFSADMPDRQVLPVPTVDEGALGYKVTRIVSNRDLPADELIWWYRGRCGASVEAHSIMKEDLA